MQNFIVWIDSANAKVFQVSPSAAAPKEIHLPTPDHHTHRKSGVAQQREEIPLFASVATLLKEAEGILIVGPGVARQHFQNYLHERSPEIGKRIKACEPSDHPTEGQIAALGREYFKD